ncbi:Ras-specific guanine nucleotide-releasing factor 1 [Pelomyxa schiedti]|nr:Ras-specific guanine nucleotide-releasing factor 1 [Pelomyxa schiedti]
MTEKEEPAVIIEDGAARRGNLQGLINLMFIEDEQRQRLLDPHGFLKTFFLTYSGFTNQRFVFNTLTNSFIERDSLHTPTAQEEQCKIIHALQMWVSLVPTDFITDDPDLLQNLMKWRDCATSVMFSFHNRARLGGNTLLLLPMDTVKSICLWLRRTDELSISSEFYLDLKKFIGTTRHHPMWNFITSYISGKLCRIPAKNQSLELPAAYSFCTSAEPCSIPLLDIMTPTECAWHMACLSCDIFRRITPKELMCMNWSKPKKAETSPNIVAMISIFNTISNWMSGYIISKSELPQRVSALESAIDLAQTLWDIHDICSCMAVLSGLNNSSVFRLKRTWEKISKTAAKKLEDIRACTETRGNYHALRQRLHNISPPALPYIGLYLTDLTFIEEGGCGYHDGLINFYKQRQIAAVILELKVYQTQRFIPPPGICNPVNREHVHRVLLCKSPSREDEQYRTSLKLEPRPSQS